MAKYKVQGIGKFVKNLITTTKFTNTQILDRVREQFPDAQTSMACIAWYQTDLRKKTKVVPVVEQGPAFGWFQPINTDVEEVVLTDEEVEEEVKV